MLVLHFGSCLGCVEPVLIKWSVSCPEGGEGGGGSEEAQWERYFSGFGDFSRSYGRVIVWMLLTWALFDVLFVSGGRVILSSIPDEVILCVG